MRRTSTIILHAHHPWVRNPDEAGSREADLFFELLVDTYLPLLEMLLRLRNEGLYYRLTLALSPTLIGLLQDPMMRDRAEAYFDASRSFVSAQIERGGNGECRELAHWYIERIENLQAFFKDRCRRDLISVIADLHLSGHLELLAGSATHALLPLLLKRPEAVSAQIEWGCRLHQSLFGERPKGFWLPECAFTPALEPLLRAAGLQFTILEEHGILHAPDVPSSGLSRPVRSAAGMFYFGRDRASSRQLWSHRAGYPGQPLYRNSKRRPDPGDNEPGFPETPLKADDDPERFPSLRDCVGLPHQGAAETRYAPEAARRLSNEHALHFVESRAAHLAGLEARGIDHPWSLTALPLDLLGHHWFEGVDFLEQVLRLTGQRQDFQLEPAANCLNSGETSVSCTPVTSSWSNDGYFAPWLSDENAWIYPHLHQRAGHLSRLATMLQESLAGLPDELAEHRERCVAQMGRELMLAQSSDWAKFMSASPAGNKARKRVESHLTSFDQLQRAYADLGDSSSLTLTQLERRHPLFPTLDWTIFAPVR